MKIKSIFIILLILGLIGGLFVYFFVWNKSHPDFAELEADFKLVAEDLYHEFVDNSEASSAKYTGKMLQLSGEASSLEKVDTLVIAVFSFNEGMFGDEGVRCTFLGEQASQIQSINDLSGFEVKGFCSGFNDTDVILEKCTLVKK